MAEAVAMNNLTSILEGSLLDTPLGGVGIRIQPIESSFDVIFSLLAFTLWLTGGSVQACLLSKPYLGCAALLPS